MRALWSGVTSRVEWLGRGRSKRVEEYTMVEVHFAEAYQGVEVK